MRIDTLYLEAAAETHAATQQILQKLEPRSIERVADYQDIFSRRKLPYLAKREKRDVVVAVKRGALVREAPPAYGYGTDDLHYYYIHAYNCVYECEYCYLQGYFSSPDLVLFVNHAEILQQMQLRVQSSADKTVWFHAGEFSDSLALSHISGELPQYWNFFHDNPRARLELRTKSNNLTVLRQLPPLQNITVSFSLSVASQAAIYDHSAPSIDARLGAMRRLREMGYRLAIHFDPIIWQDDFAAEFRALSSRIAAEIGFAAIDYISVGAVRFAKDVFREAKANYPQSGMFARNFIQGSDQKMRYVRPLRLALLENARDILKKHGCPEEIIYFCME
mgnify:CR=1 FL=1